MTAALIPTKYQTELGSIVTINPLKKVDDHGIYLHDTVKTTSKVACSYVKMYSKTNLRIKYQTVDRKTCFIYLLFKKEEITGIINHRIGAALKVTYRSAGLTTIGETNCSLKQKLTG